jgi:NTE family protein
MLSERPRLGLVLSGGGARGAYEAGVLHYIRTALPAPYYTAPFQIITGASVGAINAAFVAAMAHDPLQQGLALRGLWENVDQNRIFRRDWAAIGKFLARTVWGVVTNFVRTDPQRHRLPLARHFVSLFDTAPFPKYLQQLIPFAQIRQNIAAGHLEALALTATNLGTDRPELFLQKAPAIAYRGAYEWHEAEIEACHLMASAAIPFAFPPVRVNGTYFCDGGMRLNTPMSPAIHLGADRLLVIGMHTPDGNRPIITADDQRPGTGRLLAAITEAVFSDRVRYDLEQLTRINRIVAWGEAVYGPDFLARINAHILTSGERGDIADRGLKQIDALSVHPSRDLSEVFQEQLQDNPYLDETFSSYERFAMRLLDIDPREGREAFSYLMFAPKYLRALLDLGYQDAHARRDELIAFFEGAPLPSVFASA